AALTAVSMVGALTGGVLAGLASDRIGRRRAIVLALACGVLAIPLWAFAPSVPLLFAGAFAMQFMVQGAWGVIPADITELSPDLAALTAVSMVGALTGGVLAGLASDRIGRRRAIVLALACGVLAIPLWAFAPSVPLLFAGAFAMQFMVQGAWGVIPAHITELS